MCYKSPIVSIQTEQKVQNSDIYVYPVLRDYRVAQMEKLLDKANISITFHKT